jgi:hypothetical protein
VDATVTATAAAATQQEQTKETGKDITSSQDAGDSPEGKADDTKKGDEKTATGLAAGVAAMELGDKDKKDDKVSYRILCSYFDIVWPVMRDIGL